MTLSLVENIAWGESEVVDGARSSASIRGKVCWNARQWGGSLGLWDTRAHGGSAPGCGDATSTPTIAVATPTPTGTWNSPTETATQVFTATPTFTRTLAEGEATFTPTPTDTATVPPTNTPVVSSGCGSAGSGVSKNIVVSASNQLASADVVDPFGVTRHYEYTYVNGAVETKTEVSSDPSVDNRVTAYSYDLYGNLRGATLPDGTQITYLIDAANHRVGKNKNGQPVQRFLYAGGLLPVAELDASSAVTGVIVHGSKGNVPDYILRVNARYRIISDHLGSVRLVIDTSTGVIEQRMDYDEWGNVVLDTNPGFQPFGYAGGLYDSDTGLVRFGARDYDSELGKWTSSDPIGFQGSQGNLFLYAGADPLNSTDQTGLGSCALGLQGGRLICTSDTVSQTPIDQMFTTAPAVDIPVVSGNNLGGRQCKNNPACTSIEDHGPIPLGKWHWVPGWTAKKNGRVLEPYPETNTRRKGLRSHSCLNPFTNSTPPCSKGCIAGTVPDIRSLNNLIDMEPGSTLGVTP